MIIASPNCLPIRMKSKYYWRLICLCKAFTIPVQTDNCLSFDKNKLFSTVCVIRNFQDGFIGCGNTVTTTMGHSVISMGHSVWKGYLSCTVAVWTFHLTISLELKRRGRSPLKKRNFHSKETLLFSIDSKIVRVFEKKVGNLSFSTAFSLVLQSEAMIVSWQLMFFDLK